MATDIATFRLRFPEFEDETLFSDARIQLFLDDSVVFMGDNEARWNSKYNLAQSYLTAHLLSIGTNTEAGASQSSSGTIASKSAGGVSVSFSGTNQADKSDEDAWLLSTAYGQQYLLLRNSVFVGVLVANSPIKIGMNGLPT